MRVVTAYFNLLTTNSKASSYGHIIGRMVDLSLQLEFPDFRINQYKVHYKQGLELVFKIIIQDTNIYQLTEILCRWQN